MNFIWIFLSICLIKGNPCIPTNEKEDGSLLKDSHPIKLIDIPTNDHNLGVSLQDLVQEKEPAFIQDHFGAKLISSIQKIITDLISNPQAISFLLTLIPTFPPAAIIGCFAMVVLSILQNPTILKFLQDIIPRINPFANDFNVDTTPKYLKDFDKTNVPGLNFINEGVTYGTTLTDSLLKELNLKDFSLQELDSLGNNSESQHKTDRQQRSSSRNNSKDSDLLSQVQSRSGRFFRQGDEGHEDGIPLRDLQKKIIHHNFSST